MFERVLEVLIMKCTSWNHIVKINLRGNNYICQDVSARASIALFIYKWHFMAWRHGESFESEPKLCMGNSGYHPSVTWVSFRASSVTSAPPSPWLCSKPFCRSQSITRSDRPSTSHAEYLSVWLYSGLQLCRTTRVLRFCSHRSFSRRYVFTYVSKHTNKTIIIVREWNFQTKHVW